MSDPSWTCENGHRNPSTELTRCLDCGARRVRTSGLGSGPPRSSRDARGTITALWFVAVGLVLASVLVTGLAAAGTEDGDGSSFLALIGTVGLAVGSVVLLVAAVAEGVRLGIEVTGLARDA
jgi:hypothetical protein